MNLRGSIRLLFLLAGGATKTHVRKMGVLFVLLVSVAAASASPTTINFASLQTTNDGIPALQPDSFAAGSTFGPTQGFLVASVGGAMGFNVWQNTSPNFPGTSDTDTSLWEFNQGAQTTITFNSTQLFTLDSIDFAPLIHGGSGSFTVVVTGVIPDSNPVIQMVTITNNSPLRLQTVTFPDFTNVSAVNFSQGTSPSGPPYTVQGLMYQFNNIVVNSTSSPPPIPEPGTLLMLGSGVFGLAGVLRKKLAR
jgi:hypothetical protein